MAGGKRNSFKSYVEQTTLKLIGGGREGVGASEEKDLVVFSIKFNIQ